MNEYLNHQDTKGTKKVELKKLKHQGY